MLAGMMLHHGQTPPGVQTASDFGTDGQCPVQGVHDFALPEMHVQDLGSAQGSVVRALAAALGEECGAVKNHAEL